MRSVAAGLTGGAARGSAAGLLLGALRRGCGGGLAGGDTSGVSGVVAGGVALLVAGLPALDQPRHHAIVVALLVPHVVAGGLALEQAGGVSRIMTLLIGEPLGDDQLLLRYAGSALDREGCQPDDHRHHGGQAERKQERREAEARQRHRKAA